MEIESSSTEKSGVFGHSFKWLKALPVNLKSKVVDFAKTIKKLGEDDPRRVIHSLKVGLALSLVSIFYFYQPLYNNFGVSAMWAVMTVVVVFEYSVGATLGKGFNRAMATLVAAALGVGAHHLANLSGHTVEPILIGLLVFFLAAITTFIRFFPTIKARYDYGFLIFILTFALISVSSFRDNEILEMAHKRISTIIIGGSACMIISIVICPVWAGEDLHNLIANNMEKLSDFLEEFGDEYFKATKDEVCKDEKKASQCYKSVLNSKSGEESLANFARWEPGHGRFQFRHPWKQYLQLGTLIRQCAYRIEALNGYLNADIKASPEVRGKIQEVCIKMSTESGRALKKLSMAVKKMVQPSLADTHIENAKSAAKNLNSILKSAPWEDIELLQVIPVVTVSSLLIDVVNCTEQISQFTYELASKAQFKISVEATVSPEKQLQPGHAETDDPGYVVVNINEISLTSVVNSIGNNKNSSVGKTSKIPNEV